MSDSLKGELNHIATTYGLTSLRERGLTGVPAIDPDQMQLADGAYRLCKLGPTAAHPRKSKGGMIRRSSSLNRENARIAARGMYLAAAELCRRGFNVTPTSRNMAGADLLITDDRCRNTWTIQIKVTDQTRKRRRGWLIGRHAKQTANGTHAYVFVMINREKAPDFYVVPSTVVARKQTGHSSMPEFHLEAAKTYKDKWEILGEPAINV
jgi:hypothetical protein